MHSAILLLRKYPARKLAVACLWSGILLAGAMPVAAGPVDLIETIRDVSPTGLRQLQDAARLVLAGQEREVSRQRIFRFRWDLFENDVTRLSSGNIRIRFFENEACAPRKTRLVHRMGGFWNWSVACREGEGSFYLAIDIVNKRFSGVVRWGEVRSKIRSLDREHGIVYTVK